MHFGKGDWRSFEQGIQKEWLVTNGLGGYASSTLVNANTRKYHGLLVAALNPPVGRTLYLAKLDERLEVGGVVYNLATNETAGGVSEYGFIHQQRALIDLFPVFVYSFSDLFVVKHIFMIYGENTTVVLYRIHSGYEPGFLRLTPLVNCRDFHWTVTGGEFSFKTRKTGFGVKIEAGSGLPPLTVACSGGDFRPVEGWYRGMFYREEKERGLECLDDHYIPGEFVVALEPGRRQWVTVVATVEEGVYSLDGPALLAVEKRRRGELLQRAGYSNPLLRQLVLAADAFIVHRRSTGRKSVIAGYPWFNDWGRDAMISLPGLTLVTRRYDDAREILQTFSRYCRDGLIPNMFREGDEEPLYNTVDASLWLFHAVYKFLRYTGDHDFVREEIYPVLERVIESYVCGTRYNIGTDDDGLLASGSPGVQLTWMDAKVGDLVVTPRHGKPVEVNALWYNALKLMEVLADTYGRSFAYRTLLEAVGSNFERAFWYEEGGYLYDVIGEGGVEDPAFRPNQVIALSLPYVPLSAARARRVIRRAWRELYATYGLRSLSPAHPAYQGFYVGDQAGRDRAYHQGTVWSWLIGPFVTAYRRAYGYSAPTRVQAARFLRPFADHLRDHGIGYVSEIFDGNEPVIPRGCLAQAWGVAEVLRAYVEEVLEMRPGGWRPPGLPPEVS